jgi:hypothetical protein
MNSLSKFLLLILLIFNVFSVELNAQFSRVGIRSGILVSDWEAERAINATISYEGKLNSFLGIYFVHDLTNKWNLEYGLTASWKGFKMNGQLMIPGVQLGANLVNHSIYIDLPVSMRYVFGGDSPYGIFAKAGVQFSFLAYNKINGTVLYNGTSYYGDPESNADQLNRFDMSVFPGLGYQFQNGLCFQLTYEYGLLNIIKDDEDYLGLKTAHNSVIRFEIGIEL